MGKPSFWERLGRGVGYGWHKAKELGEQLGDQVEGKLELEKAEETLQDQYQALGRLASEQLVDGGAESYAPDSEDARKLIGVIREQQRTVVRLREEREIQKREEAKKAEAERSAEADEDVPPDPTGDEPTSATPPPE